MEKDKTKKVILKKVIFFVGLAVFLVVFFLVGYRAGSLGVPIGKELKSIVTFNSGEPKDVDFSIFWQAWNDLEQKSTANPDHQKMLQGAISGMMSSLGDPYTVYFTPEDNKRFNEDISGQFEGIGIEIISKNNLPTVVAPLSGSPAENAGIKANDIIMEVDGTKTSDIGFNEVVDKIRGAKGSKVTLKIARDGSNSLLTFSVTRDTIVVKSVEWSEKDANGKKYLYIKVRQFGDDTESLFNQAADQAIKNKDDGIIVDLRDNPGGYLDTAVDMASDFISSGNVVIEKGKNTGEKDYKATGNTILKGIKTAVLVNGGSASASEIFSGALQDTKTGEIIGEKTFGKGCVQELIPLSDGSAAKITVANWFTPNGRSITDQGITPDISIAKGDSGDAQLDRAMQYLETGK